ncbi:hypothetical protein BGZ98_002447, partial [Dissophora globulifera]
MALIQYAFKGTKHDLHVSDATTVAEFLDSISEQTEVPVAGLKVTLKGKVLRPHQDNSSTHSLLEQHPDLATGAKIFVLGTTQQDIAKVHSIDKHVSTRKAYRPPPAVK